MAGYMDKVYIVYNMVGITTKSISTGIKHIFGTRDAAIRCIMDLLPKYDLNFRNISDADLYETINRMDCIDEVEVEDY